MRKIALIDDSKTFRVYARQILEQEQYQVEEFNDAEVFFNVTKDFNEYALIITDLHMPGMSGLTALENIRFNPITEKIPVLLITGKPSKDVVELAVRYKVNDFISKPFTSDVLLSRVNKILK
ncbi:response regulator [Desulfuribacillus alkaliarsenatis]|uniref:Response regulatory domain-containing protein n=1 Tax=Desulfuribacillus alkaliarsenatis TaxID=766136 RepID=A0A1E5G0Y7_9FIRM|nr:response regulator [Desulfuribacillus alkaliarsenatis]OEF96531.1 hypothetical protein BHF68_07720 [Desulfuribacillus alkaliarsenatis]